MNTKNQPVFSDSEGSVYAQLPVQVAYLRWTRGNAALSALAETDPGQYFGGWRARVKTSDGEDLPPLPLPVVKRKSADGKASFEVYASNVIEFLPIKTRTRFELRETVNDPNTGAERTVVKAVAKERTPGYQPNKQVFGLLFNGEKYLPAVIVLDKWNTFITYNKAAGKWDKVKVPAGKALIRRYGSLGRKDKETGEMVPNFEEYGKSLSTPIEAVGLDKPRLIDITDEFVQLQYEAMEWADCPVWNKAGEVDHDDPERQSPKSKFLDACKAMGLADYEIEQLLAENDRDYKKALEALEGGMFLDQQLASANAAAEDADIVTF